MVNICMFCEYMHIHPILGPKVQNSGLLTPLSNGQYVIALNASNKNGLNENTLLVLKFG